MHVIWFGYFARFPGLVLFRVLRVDLSIPASLLPGKMIEGEEGHR